MKCRTLLVLLMVMLCSFTSQAEVKNKPVTGMKFISLPQRTTFSVGEELDLYGLKVEITFADGEVYTAGYADFTHEGFNPHAEGSQLIVIRYGEYPLTLGVNVKQGHLADITVRLKDSKRRFEGDSITAEDFTVTASYDTGNKAEVSGFVVTPNTLALGRNTITITYGDKSKDVVIDAYENTLQSVRIETPGQEKFIVGEAFNSNGLKVIATYLNGAEVNVTPQCAVFPVDTMREGNPYVEVTYQGKKTTYRVRVVDLKFDHVDISSWYEENTVSLYFVDRETPIVLPAENVTITDDHTTGVRTFTVFYASQTYTAEAEIPEDERRYLGSCRVAATVPIGMIVKTNSAGDIGYMRPASLSNKGECAVAFEVSMVERPRYLTTLTTKVTIPKGESTVYKLNIEPITYGAGAITVFTPFDVKLEVPE